MQGDDFSNLVVMATDELKRLVSSDPDIPEQIKAAVLSDLESNEPQNSKALTALLTEVAVNDKD